MDFEDDVGTLAKEPKYRALYNQVGKAIRRNKKTGLKDLVTDVAKKAMEAWR